MLPEFTSRLLQFLHSVEAAPGNILMEESDRLAGTLQNSAATEKESHPFFPKLNSGVKLGCLWENISSHRKLHRKFTKLDHQRLIF